MKFEIVTFGSPVLRVKATPVSDVTADFKRLADDMMETMYGAEGVGLAAQQVGRAVSLCVIDVPPELDVDQEGGERSNPDIPMPLVMFNPRIKERGGPQQRRDEGCLSFPGIHTGVQRAAEVTVFFIDWKGVPKTLHCRGLLARAVQHETDHLNGLLFIDRMDKKTKAELQPELDNLQAATKKEMEKK